MRRSGFAAIIGRPNVGKSTLVNQLVGTKVTITAASPNTTRNAVRGIVTEGDVQVAFVDTPGIHRPKTSLGHRLNETARASVDGVDAILVLVEAGKAVGPGDRQALSTLLDEVRRHHTAGIVVVNKVDRTGRDAVAAQLQSVHDAVTELATEKDAIAAASGLEYFPVSAKTGRGVPELLAYVQRLMPEGEFLFPDDEVSDVPEATWVAELVREQLVRKTSQELPHAIHCRVAEFEWPHILVEILVERESQKGMVIGKGGRLLKDVGIAARRQLPEGCFLELRVAVEPGWQKRDDVMDRFGL